MFFSSGLGVIGLKWLSVASDDFLLLFLGSTVLLFCFFYFVAVAVGCALRFDDFVAWFRF
jgi:hypothetical protein